MKDTPSTLTAKVAQLIEANVRRLIKNGSVLKDFMRTGKSSQKYPLWKFMTLKI